MKILILNKDISSKIIQDDFNNDNNSWLQYSIYKIMTMVITKINSRKHFLSPYAIDEWEAINQI